MHIVFASEACSLIVQLPNGVLGVKRVLGYGKRFIVDYVTRTCPEPKSAGCPLGTLEEFVLQPKQNGPLYIVIYCEKHHPGFDYGGLFG